MKITMLLFIMVGLCACQPDRDNQVKKEELKALVSEYYDGLAKKDLQKLNSLTTPNFVLYDEGVIYSNATAIKAIEEMPPFTVVFKLDSLNVHIDKANASAYYLREATFTMKDSAMQDKTYPPMRFLESATFNKEGKKWKLRFLHSSIRK